MKNDTSPQYRRLPVVLTNDDNKLVSELQYIISKRESKPVPVSKVVRMALRCLAKQENIL